jgi:hypothetical protein
LRNKTNNSDTNTIKHILKETEKFLINTDVIENNSDSIENAYKVWNSKIYNSP